MKITSCPTTSSLASPTFRLFESFLNFVQEHHVLNTESGIADGVLDCLENVTIRVVELHRGVTTWL